jgi:hypothetical protein
VNVPAGGNTSENWSGYSVAGTGYTAVGADWTVPQVTASTSLAADATWVGIGGISRTDLIQAGTQAIVQNGTTTYQAWYELLPAASQAVPLEVRPGDSMSVSVTEQAGGAWVISFTDLTENTSYETTVAYNSSLSSAEWIEEMPSDGSNFVPLDNFGSVPFSQGFVVQNGIRMTVGAAGAQAITMITPSGVVLATPSSLGTDGASFTVTRSDAASSSANTSTGTPFRRRGSPWSRAGVGVQGYATHSRGNTNFSRWQQLQSMVPVGVGRFFQGFHVTINGNFRNAIRFGFDR